MPRGRFEKWSTSESAPARWRAHVWNTRQPHASGASMPTRRCWPRRVYESWADEDVYVPLAEEIRLLKRAGFDVDIPWRRSPSSSASAARDLSSNQGIPAGSAPTQQPVWLRPTLARGLCRSMSGAVMKNLSRTDQLKRVDALRDEIDVFRRLCDGARAEALKRRHRRRTSPRRSR